VTAPSPTAVRYEYDADYRTGDEWKPLPVVMITPSVDADRVPYVVAQLTLAAIDEATFAALDPRTLNPANVGQVRWRIRQLDLAGNILGYLPRVAAGVDDYAVMHVRTITRTLESVTLTLHAAESLLDDKLCILPSDGPGRNVSSRGLLDWVLELVIGRTRPRTEIPSRVRAADDHAAEILDLDYGWGNPANTTIAHGQSYLRAVETELGSYDVRLIDAWGLGWYAATRGVPPTYEGAPTVVKLGTYTTDNASVLPDDVDPIVIELEQTVSRDGDWADAVILDGETTDGLYVNSWQQMAGTGGYRLDGYLIDADTLAAIDAHTRGRAITIDRAAPTGNLAQAIAGRATTRGHDLTVTARARFDVLPGMELQVHMRTQILTATILAVDWDPAVGTMTVRAQSATAAPPLSSTQSNGSEPTVSQETREVLGSRIDQLTDSIDRQIVDAMQASSTPFKRGRR
jgi:hypothetical protein